MKKIALSAAVALMCLAPMTGCARPGEFGYTPAYTAKERYHLIARNWDNEGKMMQDDIDSLLLLRPQSRLTVWNMN